MPKAADQLRRDLLRLDQRTRQGRVLGYAEERAHLADLYFERRLAELDLAGLPRFALLAVGGYGRGQLNPGSDLDIVLLFEETVPPQAEALAQDIFHPLWDAGLDLGHGVRSIAESLSLAKKDGQVLSSLLDARPIEGNRTVFESFVQDFERRVLARRADFFAAWLAEQNSTREARFGDSSELLEPELKNGLGGLRDAHQVGWILAVIPHLPRVRSPFTPDELARLKEDAGFLVRVRTALHLAAGRKNDRLVFDLQRAVAEHLGFVAVDADARERGRAVEFFLSRLHQAMGRIKAMRQALFLEITPRGLFAKLPSLKARKLLAGHRGLAFVSAKVKPSPQQALDIFAESARTGLPVAWASQRLIRHHAPELGSKLSTDPETLGHLLAVFKAPHGMQSAETMDATGLLSAILPEYGAVRSLVQFDDYHLHPVGPHTLHTVARLARCLDGRADSRHMGPFCDDMRDQPHPDRLLLAALFHDLGKLEPGHSQAGKRIARTALTRLGADNETMDEVAFLVRHHLLLPVTATRRDLGDEQELARVAEIVQTRERLTRLALLSVADASATGPRAWNGWTRSLFAELVSKVDRLLARGGPLRPGARQATQATRDEVVENCPAGKTFASECLDAMPARALKILTPATLMNHIALAQKLERDLEEDMCRKPSRIAGLGVCGLHAVSLPEGLCELTLAAKDRPGLFCTLTGVLSLTGLNIHAAQCFTWKNKTVVDVFTVSQSSGDPLAADKLMRLKSSLCYALVGKLDVEGRLAERRASPIAKSRTGPIVSPRVNIENESSEFDTIVEVAATDRLGLLHDLARVLADHGLAIRLAKVGTISGRVADTFHLRREDGLRLTEPSEIAALAAKLRHMARG